jgi:uncharacterized protein (TIGR02145 family)
MKRVAISTIFTLICAFTMAQDENLVARHEATKETNITSLKQQTEISEDNFISNSSYNLMDDDRNSYDVVKIGNQIWMAENLKTTTYNDGTKIPLVSDYKEWSNLNSPGYCWYRNDDGSYKAEYGALYNGFTVSTGKLCPLGWHVPSIEEWMILINYLGKKMAGGLLKEIGTEYWMSPNAGATNTIGFTALPGGSRGSYGTYFDEGLRGNWWSTSEHDKPKLWDISLTYFNSDATINSDNKKIGLSVRCVKD